MKKKSSIIETACQSVETQLAATTKQMMELDNDKVRISFYSLIKSNPTSAAGHEARADAVGAAVQVRASHHTPTYPTPT